MPHGQYLEQTLVRRSHCGGRTRQIVLILSVLTLLAGSAGCALTERRFGFEEPGWPGYQPRVVGPEDVLGGEPERGRRLMEVTYGCGACHVIPGVTGASGKVGPPLNFWAQRVYIAGTLPNLPPYLVTWIRNPQAVEPGTAMPDLGVSEIDARDIAAYLYTLRE